MAIDARYRNKNGEISRKHGNTLIRTLRMSYGSGFAPGLAHDAKLSDVLTRLDETSLRHLILDHEAGYLKQICRAAYSQHRGDSDLRDVISRSAPPIFLGLALHGRRVWVFDLQPMC
jgi:hypothetical protein